MTHQHRSPHALVKMAMMMAFAVTFALCLTACGADLSDAEKLTAEQAVAQMSRADEITLRKALFSWGDRWDVYAGDNVVATIGGEALYLTDTYTMRSTNGEIICSEEEQLSFITAKARKFDAAGEVNGWFDQEFTVFLTKIRILDKDSNVTGSVEQNLAWVLDADIKDVDGNVAWHLSEDFLSFTDSSVIHLTRKEAADNVDVTDAIMVSAVLNELTETSADSDDD